MTYSIYDHNTAVWNRLVALNLVDPATGMQSLQSVSAITLMSKTITILANVVGVLLKSLPDGAPQELPIEGLTLTDVNPVVREKIEGLLAFESLRATVDGPAARFFAELLEAHQCLTDLADKYNARTLADLFYLHSAIHKRTSIEVYPSDESRVLEVVKQLPSAECWCEHITVINHVEKLTA